MSSQLSAYQLLFKTCLQFLLGLIFFLLFFAFMILPERLVSAPIAAEHSPRSDSSSIAHEIAEEGASEWQFHLQFPFVGDLYENPPAASIAEQEKNHLTRLLMMLQHFGKEVFIPAIGIK